MTSKKTTGNVRLQLKNIFITASLLLGLTGPPFTAQAQAQVMCGDIIGDEPGEKKVVLQQTLEDCDGVEAALTVIGPATLDLNGFEVNCDDQDGDGSVPHGIIVKGGRAKIKNGRVEGCARGMWLTESGKH